jgi:hypothetical protein
LSRSGRAADELRRRALETPEDPFLFFRNERGHFHWWSWARAARELEAPAGAETAAPLVARELLERLVEGGEGEERLARALLAALGPAPERDIWISWRPLAAAPERVAALTALFGGWALLREPAERLPPSTFAWARPTLLAGDAAEIVALLDGFEAIAPRPFRGRWLRRRLARLRAVVVDGEAGTVELGKRLADLGSTARVLPFPGPGW